MSSLSAETTQASDEVKAMSPGRRRCLLKVQRCSAALHTVLNLVQEETDVPDMYSMKMFSEYKKSSCLLECRAEHLMQVGIALSILSRSSS